MLDPEGREQYRIEGFLGPDEFLVRLELGLAHLKFQRREYEDAERRFRHVVDRHGETEGAAEAQYWAGGRATRRHGGLWELQSGVTADRSRQADISSLRRAIGSG
jgi:hypothetical protein